MNMATLALSVLAACGGSNKLDLPPEAIRVHDREPIRLDIPVLDPKGRRLPHGEVKVTATADPATVVIGADGLPRCAANGATRLEVEGAGARGSLEVVCQLLGGLRVEPEGLTFSLDAPGPQEIRAEVLDEDGAPADGVPIRFLSIHPLVAEVSQKGLVTPMSPGATTVMVMASGQEARVPVVVSE